VVTHRLAQPIEATATTEGDVDLVRIGRLIWSELPLLVGINLAMTLAGTVVAVTLVTIAPLGPIVAALLLGPIWLGSTAICLRLDNRESPGWRDLIREIIARAGTGIRLALVPAVVASMLIGSIALMTADDGRRWMLAPIAADALVLIILLFGCLTVFPLAIVGDLGGRDRWLLSISLAGRHLVVSVGIVALAVLIALSLRVVGPFLAIILAGPYCLLVSVTARQTLLAPGGAEASRPQDR
jgi:hypothetical protein